MKCFVWTNRFRSNLQWYRTENSSNHFTSPPPCFFCFFFSICLVWLYWWFDSHIFQQMEFLFGRRKSPEEMLRQNQRALNRAMRELDRERNKLEQQEKKIIADIKKMAKQGQMVRRKITYKEIICIEIKRENPRWNVCRFNLCRTPLRSWPRIWFARGVTSRSSSWWKPTFRRSVWRYRRSSPTTAWLWLWKGSPKPWPPWTDRSVRNSPKCTTPAETNSLSCWQAYIDSISAAETAADSEDHDGVWAAEWNHGHEGGDDERRHRRRHGRRGWWGGEVGDWDERQDRYFCFVHNHINIS